MRTLLAFVSILAMAAPVAAQSSKEKESLSIVELAKREKERRQASEADAQVITNEQLGYRSQVWFQAQESAEAEAGEEGSSAGVTDSDAAEDEPTPEEVRAAKQAELQAQLDEELDRMDRIRTVIAQAERELADLTDLTFGTRRANLQKLIEDGEAELEASEEKLVQIEREARFAAVRVRRR